MVPSMPRLRTPERSEYTIGWLIEHNEIAGAVNVAAPSPLPYKEFMRILRDAAGTRVGLPATKWMVEVGAL
jgi:NAD dependent epimerase/dehydratase family enzyme